MRPGVALIIIAAGVSVCRPASAMLFVWPVNRDSGFALKDLPGITFKQNAGGIDSSQIPGYFQNIAQAFCDGAPVAAPTPALVVDFEKIPFVVAGPLTIDCSKRGPGQVYGINAADVSASVIAWQSSLRPMVGNNVTDGPMLSFVLQRALSRVQDANLTCVELVLADFDNGSNSWLTNLRTPLCNCGGKPVGTDLDAALFGNWKLEEHLSQNIAQLRLFEDDRRALLRMIFEHAVTLKNNPAAPGMASVKMNYLQSPAANCDVSVVRSARAPEIGTIDLGIEVKFDCQLIVKRAAGNRVVASTLTLTGESELTSAVVTFEIPRKSDHYAKTVENGMVAFLERTTSDSLGLGVYWYQSHAPTYHKEDDDVLDQVGLILRNKIKSVQWKVGDRVVLSRSKRRPCVAMPDTVGGDCIDTSEGAQIRLSPGGPFNLVLQDVQNASGDSVSFRSADSVTPGPAYVVAGTTCDDLTAQQTLKAKLVVGAAIFETCN